MASCNSTTHHHLLHSQLPPNTPKAPYTFLKLTNIFNPEKYTITRRGQLLVSLCAPQEVISGEWPENFSLLSYDDLRAYLEPSIFKDKTAPTSLLGEIMSTTIRTATVDQTLEEIDHNFEVVSGLPVINDDFVCVGIVSKKDKRKASNVLKTKVGEVMSSPAITLSAEKTVLDAAALMLKEKFHRIPIVNEGGQVVGIVTRTDIFKALEGPAA